MWFVGGFVRVLLGVLCVIYSCFGAPFVAVFVFVLLPFLCGVCCRFCV